MINTKIKIVIITNNQLFFNTFQKEFIFDNMELIYLQTLENAENFVTKVNPDVVILNWINDSQLEAKIIHFLNSIERKNMDVIAILPQEENSYPLLKEIDKNRLILYFSPISLQALVSNLKNEISLISKTKEMQDQKEFIQHILQIVYQFNKKETIEDLFDSIMLHIPKFLPFELYAVGLFNNEKKQIENFHQFSPPESDEFLLVTSEFEKYMINWASYKNYRLFNQLESAESIQLFSKWGWNVEQVLLVPLKKEYEPIGFILCGKKKNKVDNINSILGSLELINRFLIQKIELLLQIRSKKSISQNFLQQVLKSNYNEDAFFKELCKAFNLMADAEITIFWQHKKGFHILFPKFYSGQIDEEKLKLFLRELIYLDSMPILREIFQSRKWKVFDYIFEQNIYNESLQQFKKLGVHHMLVIPLVVEDMEIGIFTSISLQRGKIISPWHLNDINNLQEYAAKIYKTIEVVKEAGTKFKQLNKIFEVGNEIKLDLSTNKIYETILLAIRKSLGWNDIIVYVYDDSKNFLYPQKYVGFDKKTISNFSPTKPIEDIKLKLIFEESEKIGNSYFYREKEAAYEKNISLEEWRDSDEVIVPIETSREVLGYMVLKDPILRVIPGVDDIQPLEHFANQMAVAIENSLLFDALKSSEERYRILAETMPLALVSCDENGDILYYNPKFQELSGIQSFSLENKSIKSCFTSESNKFIEKYIHSLANEHELQTLEKDIAPGIELELKVAESNLSIPVIAFFRVLKSGLKEKFFIVLNDIREQKKLEKMRENFNSMIVHDLRSPLNVIQGFIEMMLRKTAGPLTSQQEEFLDTAMDNVRKVLNLVDNFLIMSRMKAGKFSITPQLGDINALIRKLIKQYEVVKKKKNLKFEGNLSEDLPLTLFDTFRIEQVLNNLISNAIKYSPDNGRIQINTSLHKEKNIGGTEFYIKVSVKDEGVGIPENEKEKIFKMYEMAHEDTAFRREGTGLGLAICKEIIEAHHGKIWVDSELNNGSTFHFIIPIPKSKSLLKS